jgi:PD-(D/E)XK nuclease superfamily
MTKALAKTRCTIVVHTKLAGHNIRVEAARRNANGVQIRTMDQVAARLAGGFIQPIDPDALQDAVKAALASTDLGELEGIKQLPGIVRAAVDTLDKVWHAAVDLSSYKQPRIEALSTLERAVLERLPACMKKPKEMVELALGRIQHAPAVLGPIDVHGHSEMSPAWRGLLKALAEVVPVAWVAGPRYVPDWLNETKVKVVQTKPDIPQPTLFSCATPHHEAIEALRWARSLIAAGTARPEEIAIAAASPTEIDDHVMAIARDADLPIHFVHGIKAVTSRNGQTAAALADALVKGISQERVRRLFALLSDASPALSGLPRDWTRVLPTDAPLTTVERWEQVFAQAKPEDWPDGIDRSAVVLDVLRLLAKGPDAAAEVGEKVLIKLSLALWRRALKEGPPQALPVTLTDLRIDDALEPASHIIWTSAISLASAPRPYVRLLALNTGRWPRRISEDRLIPDHIIPTEVLDPLPVADGDRRDFATIIGTARSITMSYSRRDVEGRLLGRSPLIGDLDENYLSFGRIPEHAASETDRLQARASEFSNLPIAVSALGCSRAWQRPELTSHDGLIDKNHPRFAKLFAQPLSASSLRLVLRDPIRYVWHYALGWREPEEADEPLTLDPAAFGNLVHSVLQTAVDTLQTGSGLGKASTQQIEAAIGGAVTAVAKSWEAEQPVPPPVIWKRTLQFAKEMSIKALTYPLDPLAGQTSWTEIPFGGISDKVVRSNLPWDAKQRVEIPGTGLIIRGYIDRLDVSADMSRARVIDYKTGRVNRRQSDIIVNGGRELQRCLYSFAVKTLLEKKMDVQPALLFPRVEPGEEALFPLANVDAVLSGLTQSICLARRNIENGLALPGIDAADPYNDLAFALPASATYLARKQPLAKARLGEAAKIWEAP